MGGVDTVSGKQTNEEDIKNMQEAVARLGRCEGNGFLILCEETEFKGNTAIQGQIIVRNINKMKMLKTIFRAFDIKGQDLRMIMLTDILGDNE